MIFLRALAFGAVLAIPLAAHAQTDPAPEAPLTAEAPVAEAPVAAAGEQAMAAEQERVPTEAELAEAMRIAAAANPDGGVIPPEEAAALLQSWDVISTRASTAITADKASTATFEVVREELTRLRALARAMATRTRAASAPFHEQLETLGPAPEGDVIEDHDVAVEREALKRMIASLDARARQADLAATRAEALIADIDKRIRDRFSAQLRSRGPSPLDLSDWPGALREMIDVTLSIGDEMATALVDPVAQRERRQSLPLLLSAIFVALVLGIWLRKRLIRFLMRAAPERAGRGRRVAVGAMIAATRLLLPAAALAILYFGLNYSEILGESGSMILDLAATGGALLIAAQGIAWAYYAPGNARFRLSRLDDAAALRAVRLSVALGVVLCVDEVLVRGGEAFEFSADTLSVLNLGVVTCGAVFLWGLAGLVRPGDDGPVTQKADADSIAAYAPPGDEEDASTIGRRLVALGALLMRLAAVAAVLLSLGGYYAASRYVFFPTVMTLGLLAAGVLVFIMIRDGVDAYLSDDSETGGGAEEKSGGLRLLPILAGFLIFLVLIPELALIWGARPAELVEAWSLISGGFQMGDVRLSPGDFLTFALVFIGVYTLSRLFQTVLRKSVLPNTRLDSGARNAVASFIGYAGFAIASIAAVSAAGLDLSSLAIVAGALSVGIGFGLQNVVNNFVSGIILLIERPIKVGDWIVVGGTHGTVRKISVRATEIETFDRSTLIVPNGDLISSSVMNMTHGNNVGRAIIPVGVAYGTDVEQVRDILAGVSTSHPAVLRYPAPQVLFMEFGADSLNFEIRAILRDVGQVLAVKSHMNYEIERAFREAGIEIPFAQRDLHIRNPEGLGRALAAAMRPEDNAPRAVDARAADAAPAQGGRGAPENGVGEEPR